MWKTPVAADAANRKMYVNSRGEPNLSGQVKIAPTGPPPICQQVMWPTPRAKEAGDYCYSQGKHDKPVLTLSGAAKLWPTPKASMRGDCPSERNRRSPDLSSAIKMVPTPVAGDAQGSHGGGMASSLRTFTHMFPTPRANKVEGYAGNGFSPTLAMAATEESNPKGGQLNPDWVEWLVGLPTGWGNIDIDDVQLPDKPDPHWWDEEPPIPRVATGIPHRIDRLKGYGNIAVPAQFYPIYAAIAEIENNKL